MRQVGDKGRWILRGLGTNEAGVGLRCANPTYGAALTRPTEWPNSQFLK